MRQPSCGPDMCDPGSQHGFRGGSFVYVGVFERRFVENKIGRHRTVKHCTKGKKGSSVIPTTPTSCDESTVGLQEIVMESREGWGDRGE